MPSVKICMFFLDFVMLSKLVFLFTILLFSDAAGMLKKVNEMIQSLEIHITAECLCS